MLLLMLWFLWKGLCCDKGISADETHYRTWTGKVTDQQESRSSSDSSVSWIIQIGCSVRDEFFGHNTFYSFVRHWLSRVCTFVSLREGLLHPEKWRMGTRLPGPLTVLRTAVNKKEKGLLLLWKTGMSLLPELVDDHKICKWFHISNGKDWSGFLPGFLLEESGRERSDF